MIRPATFLKLTPFYIYIFFLLLLTSLVLKILGKGYTDLLVLYAFPGLISGTLFQMYPTLQGYSLRGIAFTYLHMLLWLANITYFLLSGITSSKLYLLLSAVHLFLIALNTIKLADPIVLFILMGSFSYFVAGFYSANGNTLFLKHLITVGYFMPIITASYYVFVPMLQLEELRKRTLIWVNLLVQLFSSLLVPFSWYISNYSLLTYSGFLQLLSVGVLSYAVYDTLSQRKSPLKGLDISVKFLILGLFLCWFFLLLGIIMAWTRDFKLFLLHSDGLLYGFLTTISVGTSYHILPFLFWWRLYAPRMGRERVPTLKEVLDVKVAERLLFLIPPTLTGLLLGDLLHPYLEKLFSLAFLFLITYYTFKITPLVWRLK